MPPVVIAVFVHDVSQLVALTVSITELWHSCLISTRVELLFFKLSYNLKLTFTPSMARNLGEMYP